MIAVTELCGWYLVDESVQTGGSFKSRGVAQQMRRYVRDELGKPIVTFTSGNHGVAVALQARQVGETPTVVVPEWVESDKWSLLVRLGCHVIRAGQTATECEGHALDVCAEMGGYLAHPYRSREQIEGYTTLWSEMGQAFPDGADIIVPVGSGCLLAAGVLCRSRTSGRYRIIGAEPERCSSLRASLSVGGGVGVCSRSLAAPALNVDTTPEEVLAIVNSMEGVELFQVSDEEIAMATAYLGAHLMVVDPGAATAMAVALFRTVPRLHKYGVVVLTGAGARRNLARFESEGLLPVTPQALLKGIGYAGEKRSFTVASRPVLVGL